MYLKNKKSFKILKNNNLTNNLIIGDSFARLKLYSRAENLKNCSKISFSKVNDKKSSKIKFCHDRFCPICNKKNSIILKNQIKTIINELEKKQETHFIFLVLSICNIQENYLTESLNNICIGFCKFFKYKKINTLSMGHVRTLKIIRNKNKKSKNYNTYQLNFNILIAAEPIYFKNKDYIKQDELEQLWKRALKSNYDTKIHIENIESNTKSLTDSITKIINYNIKYTNYICTTKKETDKTIKILSTALKNHRLIGFSKIFKNIKANLKLKNIENYN